MRIVHLPPSPLGSGLRRNDGRSCGNHRYSRGIEVPEGTTKLGMLHSTHGLGRVVSDACEVTTRSEWIGVVTTSDRDQEV